MRQTELMRGPIDTSKLSVSEHAAIRSAIEEATRVQDGRGRVIESTNRVRILAGAWVESDRFAAKQAARSYIVTVEWVSPGFTLGDTVENPRVVWAGSGGYWKWCDPSFVEVLG